MNSTDAGNRVFKVFPFQLPQTSSSSWQQRRELSGFFFDTTDSEKRLEFPDDVTGSTRVHHPGRSVIMCRHSVIISPLRHR